MGGFRTVQEKLIFSKLAESEKGNVDPILKELKNINKRIDALEGNMVSEGKKSNAVPVFSSLSFAEKTLATSNIPISAPTKPPLIYGNKIFNNSIIFENVLNIEEENLTDAFLNMINDRLNGILPPLDKTLIGKVSPIASKANSYLVSFCDLFDAQHILDSNFYFSSSNLEDEKRIFVYPLLSPGEKKHQYDVLKKFQNLQVKNSSNKYNFRIYPCGYDLKLKTENKTTYFDSSADVKDNLSDEKIRTFLIDEAGVAL